MKIFNVQYRPESWDVVTRINLSNVELGEVLESGSDGRTLIVKDLNLRSFLYDLITQALDGKMRVDYCGSFLLPSGWRFLIEKERLDVVVLNSAHYEVIP